MRTDTYDLDTRLRAALDAHVADGTPANSNHSIRLSDPPDAGARPLKLLYRGEALEVASRSPRRVVDALLAGLSAWALRERSDLVEVEAVAVVGGGRAALLPASFACHSPALERRLARAGVSVVDLPVAHLDAETGEVAVCPPELAIDWEPLAALIAGDDRPSREGPPVEPGRYQLACWLLPDPGAEASPDRVAALASPPPGMGEERLVDVVTRALAPARAEAADERPAAVADAVIAALG